MGVLEEATKYKFKNIGKASAVVTFAALAAYPPTLALTQGFWGKCIFTILCWFYTGLASIGLIVLNIGIAKIQVLVEAKEFDGSFDDAFKIINERGGSLTEAEKAAIDAKVIAAHNKFGGFDTH